MSGGPFSGARTNGVRVEQPVKHLRKHAPQMNVWLGDLLGDDYESWIVLRQHEDGDYSFSLWSETLEFSISFNLPCKKYPGRANGYLGAGMTNRSPYVGEQHRRGRDLYDGPFNARTWAGVVRNVLRHALLERADVRGPLAKPKKRRTTKARSK